MEKNEKLKVKIPITIHNRYEIKVVNENNEVVREITAYNQANSRPYISNGYIDKIVISGSSRLEKYIEPYPEHNSNTGVVGVGDEINDPTGYWERDGIPYYSNGFVSCYKACIAFLSDERYGMSGYLDKVQLLSNSSVVSEAELKDIEGSPIKIEYNMSENIVINVFIYFLADMSGKDENEELYPIQWYGPAFSVLGGNCGKQLDLLEIQECRLNHLNQLISDGYLPKPVNEYLAVSKAPLPPVDGNGFLAGNINSYSILKPNQSRMEKGQLQKSKNSLNHENPILGIVRTLVLPGIGAIDLTKTYMSYGPGNHGIAYGNLVPKQRELPPCCFLPMEIVGSQDGNFLNDQTLISMNKGAFYRAGKIEVRRFSSNNYNEDNSGVVSWDGEIETIEEAPIGEAYFSDITLNARQRRCMGYSQHVPLTYNTYCAAETVIPCAPGKFKDEEVFHHGYYIVYHGDDVGNAYLKANYAVTGEAVIQYYDGRSEKISFPYKLEYSFDGNTFQTAAEFTRTAIPYAPLTFQTVAAPIWRISSNISGRMLEAANNTTHSDPFVSEAAGKGYTGYDPYFIFVGYCKKYNKYEPTVPSGVSIIEPKDFDYMAMGTDPRHGAHSTLVPYLSHPNDGFFFTGYFDPNERIKKDKGGKN